MSTTAFAVASAVLVLAQGAPPAALSGSDRYAEVGDCVQGVATGFKGEPFERMVDHAVAQCGALIPFPVPPRELAAPPADHTQAIRSQIAFRLRGILKAGSAPGHASP